MKLVSWNVNGIRAAQRAGFLDWFEKEKADAVCVQEIKAFSSDVDDDLLHPSGYHSYWHSAKKPGYSGTAIFSKTEPLDVKYGIGKRAIDDEGRVLQAEFKSFILISAYFPNSQRDHARLDYKLDFCKEMLKHCEGLRKKGKNLVLCGDFNIAHREIDLKNAKTNKDNAGFLPEERAWMDTFTGRGYVDTFRKFEPGPDHYTWWSQRAGVRAKNVGWRIDYHVVNPEFSDRVKACDHYTKVMGSDHCPIALQLKK